MESNKLDERAAHQGGGGRNQGRGRGIGEVTRGRGNGGGHHGGRGRGGNQGGRNQNRNQRRGNGGGRRGSHPDEETIVLRNGKHIKYHASYDIPDEDYHQMTPGQKDRMKAERAAWKRANGGGQRGGDQQDRIAQLERQIQALQQSISDAGTNEDVPREVPQITASSTSRIGISTNFENSKRPVDFEGKRLQSQINKFHLFFGLLHRVSYA